MLFVNACSFNDIVLFKSRKNVEIFEYKTCMKINLTYFIIYKALKNYNNKHPCLLNFKINQQAKSDNTRLNLRAYGGKSPFSQLDFIFKSFIQATR